MTTRNTHCEGFAWPSGQPDNLSPALPSTSSLLNFEIQRHKTSRIVYCLECFGWERSVCHSLFIYFVTDWNEQLIEVSLVLGSCLSQNYFGPLSLKVPGFRSFGFTLNGKSTRLSNALSNSKLPLFMRTRSFEISFRSVTLNSNFSADTVFHISSLHLWLQILCKTQIAHSL